MALAFFNEPVGIVYYAFEAFRLHFIKVRNDKFSSDLPMKFF